MSKMSRIDTQKIDELIKKYSFTVEETQFLIDVKIVLERLKGAVRNV